MWLGMNSLIDYPALPGQQGWVLGHQNWHRRQGQGKRDRRRAQYRTQQSMGAIHNKVCVVYIMCRVSTTSGKSQQGRLWNVCKLHPLACIKLRRITLSPLALQVSPRLRVVTLTPPWSAEWNTSEMIPMDTLAINEHYLETCTKLLTQPGIKLVPVLRSPHVPYVFALTEVEASRSVSDMCAALVDTSPAAMYPTYS